MTAFVLDASAVIRYMDNESGAARVEEIFKLATHGKARILLSAVQWGELAGNLHRRFGAAAQARLLETALPAEMEIEPATAARAEAASALKVEHGISYADAFAAALALERKGSVLLTADYGFKAVEELIQIQFLPQK